MNNKAQDTLTPLLLAASTQAGRANQLSARPDGKKANGGKRPGAGRPMLPLKKLRRKDLADRRELKRPRPKE